jgi:hypothetical protein
MMNESTRAVFSKLLDANYEFTQMQENLNVSNIKDYIALGKKVSQLNAAFREGMGEGYQKFMDDGAKMFAPRA